jgi:DNA-binding CsgD family transcriptional regulator
MVDSAIGGTEDRKAPILLAVQRRPRLPLVIRALRLMRDGRPPRSSASLLLLALDPELRRAPPREILAQAFGLTPVEADVAIGIASGRALAEIAAHRGITIGTVRIHLKSVFLKTHTHGQAGLTRLLTCLAFQVPQMEGKIAQLLYGSLGKP